MRKTKGKKHKRGLKKIEEKKITTYGIFFFFWDLVEIEGGV